MDIIELIKTAKLGRERKDAQVDTCAPFAAALHDVLIENGLDVTLSVACHKGATYQHIWYHLVVQHGGTYYDSLGEFSKEIIRKRLKIHPSVDFPLTFEPETRPGCYEEDDYEALFEFFAGAFRKAAAKLPNDDRFHKAPGRP